MGLSIDQIWPLDVHTIPGWQAEAARHWVERNSTDPYERQLVLELLGIAEIPTTTETVR